MNIDINFGFTEIQILNNITNKVISTSKTHLLTIEINRNRFVQFSKIDLSQWIHIEVIEIS